MIQMPSTVGNKFVGDMYMADIFVPIRLWVKIAG